MSKKNVLLLPIIYTIILVVIKLITSFVMRYINFGELNMEVVMSSSVFSILAMSVVFYTCFYYSNYNRSLSTALLLLISYYLFVILIKTVLGRSIFIGLFNISEMVIYSLMGLLLYLAYDRFNKIKMQKELEKQNIQSELALLKNQINPHFLFNTLNNIDSLIKSNPSKASDTLVELSDMMRYMIYDTNVAKVPLKQELDYIDNYLKLQSLQYANPNLVKYEVNGNFQNITVPPMLFIPFIENAFKHCTDKESKDAITFSFDISHNSILFEAVNIYDENQKITKDKSSGVGLDIVKRRLEILYPNKHQLTIEQKSNLFCISLKIELND